MSDTSFGATLSPEEEAFFESGGETAISDTGSDNAGGDSGTDSGADGSTGDKGADTSKTNADKAPSTVPLAALHEERNRRREMDKQLREARERIANFEGRFAIIEKLNKPGEGADEAPKGPPAVEEDIFGNVKHVGETVAQIQKRLDDADKAKADSDKAATDQATFVTNYRADADTFKAKAPDYMDAYNHLLGSRAQELIAIGYANPADDTLTPQERQAAAKALHDAVVADEHAIAKMAFDKGKSPAEIIYGLAKQRGYQAKAAGEGKDGKGAEKLATIERGQQANKSLSNTGGSAGDADMTAERLMDMPIDEFEAWCEKNPAKAKRIMGG